LKINPNVWLAVAITAFLGGLIAFFFLFILDFNIYWLILSPLILAIYQSPAAYFFWLYKKTKKVRREQEKKSAPDGI
jgi:phosphotransferase system  glucose/maltose/N-acetylglucosamine-specific IIC component